MRIVIALGSQALRGRPGPMTVQVQHANIRSAAQAIVPLAAEHSILVVHGIGPQASLPTRQAASHPGSEPYPLDVLDAGTQGMIGYLIQKELRKLLPPQTQVATVITMITVDPADPAFAHPSTFVGPVYHQDASGMLAAKRGWTFRRDGTAWRRVVPSPEPRQILEIKPITWLLDHGAVVVCAGGGGLPSVHPMSEAGDMASAEAVIDRDLASERLAEDVGADLFVLATDVNGVYLHWGTPAQRRLRHVTPGELASYQFAAGSMGPKAEAAARFATRTGRRATIGSLADILRIVAGNAGTDVVAPAEQGPLRPAAGDRTVIAGIPAGQATPRMRWNPPGRVPPRPAETG